MAEGRQQLEFSRRKDFTNEFGESSMHIMKVNRMLCTELSHLQECLFSFGVAFALQKDSPYTNKFETYTTFLDFVFFQGSAARSSS